MDQPNLGKELSRIRNLKGITQEELALKSKVTIRTIQRIESGHVNPRSYTIRVISKVLDYDFYSGFDTPFDNEKRGNWLSKMNLLVNKIWSNNFFNLKTNTMSKLFILTAILGLGTFGLITLTNSNAQNALQSAKESASNGSSSDEINVLLPNLNNTYKEINYVVISENEIDSKAEQEIRMYVEKIKGKFFPNIPLIYDTEAIKMDLSKYSFMIYGTIKNNVFLQKFSEYMPIQISDSAIIADKEYKVKNCGAIFNLTNPLNPSKYLVVYTTQQPSGIPGINSVFHGPTNFVIFDQQWEPLSSGFFKRSGNKWACKK